MKAIQKKRGNIMRGVKKKTIRIVCLVLAILIVLSAVSTGVAMLF